MANQPRQPDERPVFTGIVDRFVEFVDMAECDLGVWKAVPRPAGPPDRIYTAQVDEFHEFNDVALPPVSLNGNPEIKPA